MLRFVFHFRSGGMSLYVNLIRAAVELFHNVVVEHWGFIRLFEHFTLSKYTAHGSI